MSTLMETQNPEAHARLVNPIILPSVGKMVIYHLRATEKRAGRTFVPALVMNVDRDNMRLDLLLIYDQHDQMLERSVPPRIGSDRGWELQPDDTAALRQEIDSLRGEVGKLQDQMTECVEAHAAFKQELSDALFGDWPKPAQSVEDRLLELQENWESIQPILRMKTPAAPAAPKGKAKRK